MTLFKPRIGKVIFAQTTGGLSVIIPKKYKSSVCFVYIGTCEPLMAIEIMFSKLCISCSLDEHLYAQLSKWALWFLFVMSKIK